MTTRSKSIDYARVSKLGLRLGGGMFVLGVLGEIVGNAVVSDLPGWEEALFTDMIGLGVLTAFVSFFVVGVFLPIALE